MESKLANSVRRALQDNADLLEARFLSRSLNTVEWLEDVTETLVRHVCTKGDDVARATFADMAKLRLLLEEDLRGYGVDDVEIGSIVKLLHRVLSTSRQPKRVVAFECGELVKWLHSGEKHAEESVACIEISEREFAAMKQHNVEGTARILDSRNAGGNSHMSEAYSFEVLSCLLSGRIVLDKTEMEIEYKDDQTKITDYCFKTFSDEKIGVSVTRACGHEFDEVAAVKLLQKKLHGVNESSRNVNDSDAWKKQVLHVWCESMEIANVLTESFQNCIKPEQKRDTFVLLSVVEEKELFYSSEESANVMRHGGIKLTSVKSVFSKEIAARPSYDTEPTLSSESLACRNHSFYGEPLGGLKCQICNFETKNRVWKCKECDIALCGSCMDKWKSKINK